MLSVYLKSRIMSPLRGLGVLVDCGYNNVTPSGGGEYWSIEAIIVSPLRGFGSVDLLWL